MTTETKDDGQAIDSWAILELMGHVKLAGKVTEETHFGTVLGRIEIPLEDGSFITQMFGGSSVYRLTPCTEQIARVVARANKPQPVSVYDLKALLPPATEVGARDIEDDDEMEARYHRDDHDRFRD